MSNRKKLQKIIDNGYGVRSGAYSGISQNISMYMDGNGEYQYQFTGEETDDTLSRILKVDMMSDDSVDEGEISKRLFGDLPKLSHDSEIGYYSDLYIGYVQEGSFRQEGSSGGMTTWLLNELLRTKKIDGVIHVKPVDPKQNDGILFEYAISRSEQNIRDGAKSRYYPTELSKVIKIVKQSPGEYAVVGIPEFITELRLLAQEDPIVRKRIKYMLGIVCGHQKTAKYAEALAWQCGIEPGDLQAIDFRVKQPNSSASNYLHKFTGIKNQSNVSILKTHAELFGEVWAYGFFKSKFSDYTDNVFNETADVVFGDAWLPQYDMDGRGNNIIIVRNNDIANIISEANKANRLVLDRVDAEVIKESQRGLIHHARDELGYRLYIQKNQGKWIPKKRIQPSNNLSAHRKRVQDIRLEMATISHIKYQQALMFKEWSHFEESLRPYTEQYQKLYSLTSENSHEDLINESMISRVRKKVRIRSRVRAAKHSTSQLIRVRTRLRRIRSVFKKKHKERLYDSVTGAILTLTGYFNYGNILQRYALQEILRQNNKYYISIAREPISLHGEEKRKYIHTHRFIEQNIVRRPFDKIDMNSYSAFVVGSDQVWRRWGTGDEKDELGYFFLDFLPSNLNTKRVSYAASFGYDRIEKSMSDGFIKYIKPYVRKFDAISVREDSAVQEVKRVWGVNAKHVLDPTLLLKAEDYDSLIEESASRLDTSPGIFSYIVISDNQKQGVLDAITKETGLLAGVIQLDNTDITPPVEQWLKNFRDSQFVVTDSFHGMVFSILNKTPFIILESEAGGAARVTSLLTSLGLEKRFIRRTRMDAFQNEGIGTLGNIDWAVVEKKLGLLRKESIDWLIGSLTGG
ncbi:MAG: hypothetical protein EOL93_08220 [Epsilonproteobacteria bacterium]|nr:hypothetical protein [Campylobacterota bacterium]